MQMTQTEYRQALRQAFRDGLDQGRIEGFEAGIRTSRLSTDSDTSKDET